MTQFAPLTPSNVSRSADHAWPPSGDRAAVRLRHGRERKDLAMRRALNSAPALPSPARMRSEAELAGVLDAIAARWRVSSQREIARQLGLERGVVSGLVMRARQNGDKRFPRRPNPKPRSKAKPKTRPPRQLERPPSPPEPPARQGPRLLIDLSPTACRWPVSATTDGLHLFCGKTASEGRPYCRQHCERASPGARP